MFDYTAPIVTIVSNSTGIPVSGSTNTFDYPILSSVNLTCMVNPTPSLPVTYQWNTTGCYTNSKFTGSNPQCFPHGQTTQNVTGNDLNAEDAGTITCTVTISGSDYTSEPFTLHISGEQLVYCVITCIVYCKQCMLLLLATCYCCIIHQLLWFMYRGVFTVGVALTRNSLTDATDFLTDYSYIHASYSPGNGVLLARCLTGLGPTGTNANASSDLGGWYFNGTMITNSGVFRGCDDPAVGAIQARPGVFTAGVINLRQCDPFTIALEGIYTCTMMNSSMMNQSVNLGVYFTGRSELLDLSLIRLHFTWFTWVINLLLPNLVYLLHKPLGTKKHYRVLILYQLPMFIESTDVTINQFHH